jgi:hypothetical protein
MTQQELAKLFDEFTGQQKQTLLKKNNDYADADALSNFKLAGSIAGIGAVKQCLSMISVKVARLGVLTSGKTPQNESIADSVLDLANYAFLLHAILKDESDLSGR